MQLLSGINWSFDYLSKQSLVHNLGFDGTGVHCPLTKKYNNNSFWSKVKNFNLPDKIEHSEVIREKYKTFINTYKLEFGQVFQKKSH